MEEDLESRLAAARERVRASRREDTPAARRAAVDERLRAERDLAAARGEPYAQVIDIGPRWNVGAPLPHLISNGSRAFLVCLADRPDPTWDGSYVTIVSPVDAGRSLLVVIEIWGCQELRFGGPNDEAIDGHPLYGKGLDSYCAHEVLNSAWIEDAIKVNSVHPDHSDAPFRRLRHYVLLFHDDMLETLASGISSRLVTGTIREVLRDLSDSLIDQP